jgi:hypothetical protein
MLEERKLKEPIQYISFSFSVQWHEKYAKTACNFKSGEMYLMLTNVSEVGMIYQTPHIF